MHNTVEAAHKNYVETFFARQPIFDAANKVFGHELLYRQSAGDTAANITDKDAATINVISMALASSPNAGDNRKIAVHFSPESILAEMPSALPAASMVELAPQARLDEPLACALAGLKRQGYTIAINGYKAENCDKRLVALADVVFVDILGQACDVLAAQVKPLRGAPCLLGAKRVEDRAAFAMAKKLGFKLFQGFYFEKPVIVPGRKLPTTKVARLNLCRALEKPDMDVAALAKVIESDVSISYRLLTYINSAAFGLRNKVSSIKHAIMLLGWRKIKNWLWMVVLADVLPKDKTTELTSLSSIRAKFLEVAATGHDPRTFPPDTMFLMGLFSLLEPMLDTPMADLVKFLPLEDEVVDALTGRQNPWADWLAVAGCFESGDWDKLDNLTERLGFDPVLVASAYCEALLWAKTLFDQPEQG